MTEKPPVIEPRRSGLLHMMDAARYSWAGLRRLLAESAARLELVGGAVGAVLFAAVQAPLLHWVIFAALFCALLAVETLNTAIEVVVNHLSPGWSQMAKEAKDLGSLAVGLMILANLIFVAAVVCLAVLG